MTMLAKIIGATVALVASGAAGYALAATTNDAPAPPAPALTVYEDGCGTVPAGTRNGVLGDLSGRTFCVTGAVN